MALSEITLKQAVQELAAKARDDSDTAGKKIYMLVELRPYDSAYRLAEAAKLFMEE